VFEVIHDLVLIRTFLFLTMQGTSESDLLREKLRLRRSDIEFNQLDDVYTFLFSDLARDPELALALENAGAPPYSGKCRQNSPSIS
jgi:hypothetical protein